MMTAKAKELGMNNTNFAILLVLTTLIIIQQLKI